MTSPIASPRHWRPCEPSTTTTTATPSAAPLRCASASASESANSAYLPHGSSSCSALSDLGTVFVDRSIAIDCGGTRCKVVCFHRAGIDAGFPEFVTVDEGPRVPVLEHVNSVSPLQYLTLPTRRLPEWLDWCRDNKTLELYENIDKIYATGGGAFKYRTALQEKLSVALEPLSEMGTLVDGLNLLLTLAPAGEVFEYSPKTKQKQPPPPEALASPYPYLIVSVGSGVSIIKVTGEGVWERVSGSCIGGGTFWGLSKLLTEVRTWDELEDVRQVEGQTGDNANVDLLVGDIYGKRCTAALGLSETVIASSFGKAGVCSSEESDVGPRSPRKRNGGVNGGGATAPAASAAAPTADAPSCVPSLECGANARRKKFRKKKGQASGVAEPASPAGGGGSGGASSGSNSGRKAEQYHAPDVCRSLLLMVANNIGQIAHLNAKIHGVSSIYFTGGFTHDNPYVWSKLSYAINFWSKGEMRARFLEHDGYLGALGALVHQQDE